MPPDWFLDFAAWSLEASNIHGFTDLDGKLVSWTRLSKECSITGAVCAMKSPRTPKCKCRDFNLDTARCVAAVHVARARHSQRGPLDELKQHIPDRVVPSKHATHGGRSSSKLATRWSRSETEAAYHRVYWGKLRRKHARMRYVIS